MSIDIDAYMKTAAEDIDAGIFDGYIEQFWMIEQLQTELENHRWIPVSERLPEKTEEDLRPEVLVYDGESVTGALWRHYNCGWDFETDRGSPTHWKPIILPEQTLRDGTAHSKLDNSPDVPQDG